MFTRSVLGRVFSSSRKAVTAARISNIQKHNAPLSYIASYAYVPNYMVPRFYSKETKPEVMTADFDYVKKATTSSDVLIIDVREPDEIIEHGKIPNSINIPLGNVTSVLGTMSDKEFQETFNKSKPRENTEIIFYCMIGKRSGKAQDSAIGLGYKNVKNYLGSWTDWASKQ